MIPECDRAYIAGLFDGEGSIHMKRGPEKKKKHKGNGYRISNSLRLSMEITMTDRSVLSWVHQVLGVGTLTDKPRKGRRVDGTKYLNNTDGDVHLEMHTMYVVYYGHGHIPNFQKYNKLSNTTQQKK